MNRPRISTTASRTKKRINSMIEQRINQSRSISSQRTLKDKNAGLQVRNIGGQSGEFASFGSLGTGNSRVGP